MIQAWNTASKGRLTPPCSICLPLAHQVTAIFKSSVEVMISVWGETPEYAGDMFHCGDAYATIVSGRCLGKRLKLHLDLWQIVAYRCILSRTRGVAIVLCVACSHSCLLLLPTVDENGDPVDVPFELAPSTPAEQLRYQGGVAAMVYIRAW